MNRSKNDWEAIFASWGQPLGKVEDEKAERAVRAVNSAVSASPKLRAFSISTFVQGSYRNNTGVRQESDVDVAILYPNSFFHSAIPGPFTGESLGFSVATYQYSEFRDDVERALVDHFGRPAVKNGDKAFKIRENTYRVDADVVPCFRYIQYSKSGDRLISEDGTCLWSRSGSLITNFPEQQYQNGVQKNSETLLRFKAMVRVIKKLSCEMEDSGVASARPMKSFLIECLVWNCQNGCFLEETLFNRVESILLFIYAGTKDGSSKFFEENVIKPLFRTDSAWTVGEVNTFSVSALRFIGAI